MRSAASGGSYGTPLQDHHRHRQPAGDLGTSSGTTISALAARGTRTRCDPWPRRAGGRHTASSTPRTPRSELTLPLGRAQPLEADGPHLRAVDGSAPSIRRITGRTNTSKETYARTGLPGKREDRRESGADGAEALRLAGLHGDLAEVAPCRAGEHLLDDVVRADAHPARGDQQVGADRAGPRSRSSSVRGSSATVPTR